MNERYLPSSRNAQQIPITNFLFGLTALSFWYLLSKSLVSFTSSSHNASKECFGFTTLSSPSPPSVSHPYPIVLPSTAKATFSVGCFDYPPWLRCHTRWCQQRSFIRLRCLLSCSSSFRLMGHPLSFDGRSVLSMTLPCPTRNLRGQVALARRRPGYPCWSAPRLGCILKCILTYLLLELFVYCIQSILDGYTLQIPSSDFEAQREVQINLLHRRIREKLLERVFLIKCCRRSIKLPVSEGKCCSLIFAFCSRQVYP